MPDAAWAVSVHPPSLSREKGQPPVLTSSNPLSTLHQRFAYARLSQSCLPESRSGFPQRSPPWLLTTAACGGLRPAPDCRPRRVIPSSLVQLRIAVWTGVTRDTRPLAEVASLIRSRRTCGTIPPLPPYLCGPFISSLVYRRQPKREWQRPRLRATEVLCGVA